MDTSMKMNMTEIVQQTSSAVSEQKSKPVNYIFIKENKLPVHFS